MSEPFNLVVPADAAYRRLVPEVAGRYAELCGGTPADGTALADALIGVLDRLVGAANPAPGIHLAFHAESGAIHVHVQCGGQDAVVRQKVGTAA